VTIDDYSSSAASRRSISSCGIGESASLGGGGDGHPRRAAVLQREAAPRDAPRREPHRVEATRFDAEQVRAIKERLPASSSPRHAVAEARARLAAELAATPEVRAPARVSRRVEPRHHAGRASPRGDPTEPEEE